MNDSLFKMLMLNGPLKGREIRLPAGAFSWGQGDADLLLPLEAGLAQLTFEVTVAGVTLKTETAPCWIAGKRSNANQPLPLKTVIDVAGQAFILSNLDQLLSFQPIPLRNHFGWQSLSVLDIFSLNKWRKKTQYFWLLFSLVVSLLAIFVFGMSYLVIRNRSTHPSISVSKWLQTQVKEFALEQLEFEWQMDGSLKIAGSCEDSAALQPILSELQKARIYVHQKAVCNDQLVRIVTQNLRLLGYRNIEVRSNPSAGLGEVDILGVIADDPQWQRATDVLEKIPELKRWYVINPVSDSFNAFVSLLINNNLANRLSVISQGKNLLVRGELPAADQELLKKITEYFQETFPDAQGIVYQNLRATENLNEVFPTPIVSILGNTDALFIELKNGSRFQVGAKLSSGYEIRYIDPTYGISAIKEGKLLHIPINL